MATIVITGAARGIGRELAKAYVTAGDQVVIGVRDPARAAEPGCEVLDLDVAIDASVATFADRLGGRPIDLLINNAGVIGPDRQSPTEMDFAGFAETLAINTLGPLRVTQALLPNLRRAKGARVAVISSFMGSMSRDQSDHLAYRVSKAGANKVVQGLATALRGEGIAVASLHPGWVRTDMGGAGAALSPSESAAGLKQVLDALTLETTGRFWNYDGKPLPW